MDRIRRRGVDTIEPPTCLRYRSDGSAPLNDRMTPSLDGRSRPDRDSPPAVDIGHEANRMSDFSRSEVRRLGQVCDVWHITDCRLRPTTSSLSISLRATAATVVPSRQTFHRCGRHPKSDARASVRAMDDRTWPGYRIGALRMLVSRVNGRPQVEGQLWTRSTSGMGSWAPTEAARVPGCRTRRR
jgi:hypothetical protein